MKRGILDRHGRRHAPTCEHVGEWRGGFHTTAVKYLPSIERTGLVPYPLYKEWAPPVGVWVWLEPARTDLDELGVAVQRMLDHETFEVAMLAVSWPRCAEWGGCAQEFDVNHEGHFTGNRGNVWQYHCDRPARIVVETIPPRRITLVRTYDLRALLGTPATAPSASTVSRPCP